MKQQRVPTGPPFNAEATAAWLNARPQEEPHSSEQVSHETAQEDGMNSTKTYPPLTAEDFADGCVESYKGIAFCENEDGDYVYAHGHVDRATFAQAVNTYDDSNGALDPHDAYGPDDVGHTWAVLTEPPPEWWMTWHNVTAETPGAFPITVISR